VCGVVLVAHDDAEALGRVEGQGDATRRQHTPIGLSTPRHTHQHPNHVNEQALDGARQMLLLLETE
jgi:hypothetical protein